MGHIPYRLKKYHFESSQQNNILTNSNYGSSNGQNYKKTNLSQIKDSRTFHDTKWEDMVFPAAMRAGY